MDRKIEKKRWTLKRIMMLGAAAVVFLFLVFWTLFHSSMSTLNVRSERITISEVIKGPFQEDIPIIGSVLPIDTRYLDAVEGGVVEEVFVEDGTLIKKGQKILKLSNTALLINIMRSEADVNRASNELRSTRLALEQNRLRLESELADLDYQILRQKRLYDQDKVLIGEGMIPRQEYEDVRDQYEYLVKKRDLTRESQEKDLHFQRLQIAQLESDIGRMMENLKLIKKRQEDLIIKAPVEGLLTSFRVEIGETIPAGERIAKVDILDGFKVQAQIDEHYLNRIETGKTGTFPFDNKEFSLRVKKIYQEVTNNRFEVDLEFTGEQPQGIKRGQTLHIRLALSEETVAILLPRGGFYQQTGGNWVYVVDQSGGFAIRRDIRLNRQTTQYFEVLSGLEPGERVITSSYENFGDMERLVLKSDN
jgi:HlyD family secretion protein